MVSSEFDLIYRYLAAFGAGDAVTLGVGDDAAILSLPPGSELVVSTDTQLEGRHFPEDVLPEQLAFRAVAAAASDLAAMAAAPLAMTLALTLPQADELWLHSFSMGLGKVVAELGLPLVGGDLTRGPLSLTVTVMGSVPVGTALRRSTAQDGDLLCVTGTLGDAAAALAMLQGELPGLSQATAEYLECRFFEPSVRFECRDWLQAHAHAAIDISDGLLADVGHMAAGSGLACHLDSRRIPLSLALSALPSDKVRTWALEGGDDYELAIAVPPDVTLPKGLTAIGRFLAGNGVYCDGDPALRGGFDHFGGVGS